MQDTAPGALTGKARRTRHRGRAARLYSQQLIDDYVDPDPGPSFIRLQRRIPIRHRSEFLSPAGDGTGDYIDSQLELTFPEVQASTATEGRTESSASSPTNDHRSMPDGERMSVAPLGSRPRDPAERTCPMDATEGLNLSGFACGCMVGGAAAAVVLLILQTVCL